MRRGGNVEKYEEDEKMRSKRKMRIRGGGKDETRWEC